MKTEHPAKITITYGCCPVDLQPPRDTHDCMREIEFGGKIIAFGLAAILFTLLFSLK